MGKGGGQGRKEAGTVAVSCDTDKCNKPNLTICMSGQRESISHDLQLSPLPGGKQQHFGPNRWKVEKTG